MSKETPSYNLKNALKPGEVFAGEKVFPRQLIEKRRDGNVLTHFGIEVAESNWKLLQRDIPQGATRDEVKERLALEIDRFITEDDANAQFGLLMQKRFDRKVDTSSPYKLPDTPSLSELFIKQRDLEEQCMNGGNLTAFEKEVIDANWRFFSRTLTADMTDREMEIEIEQVIAEYSKTNPEELAFAYKMAEEFKRKLKPNGQTKEQTNIDSEPQVLQDGSRGDKKETMFSLPRGITPEVSGETKQRRSTKDRVRGIKDKLQRLVDTNAKRWRTARRVLGIVEITALLGLTGDISLSSPPTNTRENTVPAPAVVKPDLAERFNAEKSTATSLPTLVPTAITRPTKTPIPTETPTIIPSPTATAVPTLKPEVTAVPVVVTPEREPGKDFMFGNIDMNQPFTIIVPKDMAQMARYDDVLYLTVDPYPQYGEQQSDKAIQIFEDYKTYSNAVVIEKADLDNGLEEAYIVQGHSLSITTWNGKRKEMVFEPIRKLVSSIPPEALKGKTLFIKQKLNGSEVIQRVDIADSRIEKPDTYNNAYKNFRDDKKPYFFDTANTSMPNWIKNSNNRLTFVTCENLKIGGLYERILLTVVPVN